MCIPCRDEVATIGPIVGVIRHELMRTGAAGRRADRARRPQHRRHRGGRRGARAPRWCRSTTIHAAHGEGHGKGNALWASLVASTGDFVVWCDGDITCFEPHWVVRLLAPMLDDDSVALVKAM